MQAEVKNCQNCKQDFRIGPEDFDFYNKIGVQPPRHCPKCRAQLRLLFRNERVFYKRACDKCRKEVISMYSPNKPYPVWCYDCWFADDWDASDYGQEYDPGRPFLEQLLDLYNQVPKVALIYVRSVNSDYVNISADNKDCHMLIESSNNEGCIHSYWVQQCKDSVDLSFSHRTELSYESDDCYNCYGLLYSRGCYDSSNSSFLLDCRGVTNCIGCVNLRNKTYCIFNKQVSREEYEKFIFEARLDTSEGVEVMRRKFEEFALAQPRKYAEITNSPGSTGNYMSDAKNCRDCFHCYDAEDSRYGEHVWRNAKDCMDVSTAGRNASLVYNSINTGIDVGHMIVCAQGWSSTFMEYSFNCFNSDNCFGCAGLRKKKYCVLNKQYSKEEYEKIKMQIIAEFKGAGIYGEFFPKEFSPFGYNESCVQEQFPLSKEEALMRGFRWEDHPRGTYGKETIRGSNVPASIRDFQIDDINKEVFACENCRKNYRIIPGELQFYRRMEVPLPRLCPDCRHSRRISQRGPNLLFAVEQCSCEAEHPHHSGRCKNDFRSNFAPGHPEKLYCEACYNAEVA